jgi:hypothetical protein
MPLPTWPKKFPLRPSSSPWPLSPWGIVCERHEGQSEFLQVGYHHS